MSNLFSNSFIFQQALFSVALVSGAASPVAADDYIINTDVMQTNDGHTLAESDSLTVTKSARIDVTGRNAYGIYASDAPDATVINSGTIHVTGRGALGILASNSPGITIVNDGAILSDQDNDGGIYVDSSDGASITNNGTILDTGRHGAGLSVGNSENVMVTNTGDISAITSSANGISLNNLQNSIFTNTGTVNAESPLDPGGTPNGTPTVSVRYGEQTRIVNDGTFSASDQTRTVIKFFHTDQMTFENSGVVTATSTGATGVLLNSSTIAPLPNTGFTLVNSGTISASQTDGTVGTAIQIDQHSIDTTLNFETGSFVAGRMELQGTNTAININMTDLTQGYIWTFDVADLADGAPNITGLGSWDVASSRFTYLPSSVEPDATALVPQNERLGALAQFGSLSFGDMGAFHMPAEEGQDVRIWADGVSSEQKRDGIGESNIQGARIGLDVPLNGSSGLRFAFSDLANNDGYEDTDGKFLSVQSFFPVLALDVTAGASIGRLSHSFSSTAVTGRTSSLLTVNDNLADGGLRLVEVAAPTAYAHDAKSESVSLFVGFSKTFRLGGNWSITPTALTQHTEQYFQSVDTGALQLSSYDQSVTEATLQLSATRTFVSGALTLDAGYTTRSYRSDSISYDYGGGMDNLSALDRDDQFGYLGIRGQIKAGDNGMIVLGARHYIGDVRGKTLSAGFAMQF